MNHVEIEKLVSDMEEETVTIRREAFQMAWHMRGGLTYNDALDLCVSEREIISGIIKEHIDTTNKTGLNYF